MSLTEIEEQAGFNFAFKIPLNVLEPIYPISTEYWDASKIVPAESRVERAHSMLSQLVNGFGDFDQKFRLICYEFAGYPEFLLRESLDSFRIGKEGLDKNLKHEIIFRSKRKWNELLKNKANV